jgi:hypothetical protein
MSGRGEKYQGKPCKRDHNGVRYVKGGTCVQCAVDGAELRRQLAAQKKAAEAPKPAAP